ncbi:hypothetical protein RKD44_001457 [Streptomyces collinus]
MLVEVVAPVGIQAPGLAAGTPPQTSDRRNGVEQGQELGDAVPVATGERDGERGSVTVDDQVVLRARAGPIDGRGPDVVPPFSARTCDPSTEQSFRSSRLARRSSVNRAACRRGQTPASVQSRSRRQAFTPEEPTASAGTSRHATPVRSTYMTPASAIRSGIRSRPGWRRRRSGAGGSSGATRSHRSSGTRSARRPDTLPTKIAERKTHGSTHSEMISNTDRCRSRWRRRRQWNPGGRRQPTKPSSLAISMRCTSLVPSPISRILESRHIRATGYSFMKP